MKDRLLKLCRLTLVIAQMPGLLLAQQDPIVLQRSVPQTIPSTLLLPSYRTYTYFQSLRQGRAERAALMVNFGTYFIVSARNSNSAAVPLKLEIEDGDGLTLGSVTSGKDSNIRIDFIPGRIRVMDVDFPMQFKIAAPRNARLGMHIIRGRLMFQGATFGQVSPQQQIEILFPVTVVGSHEHAARDAWPLVRPRQNAPTYALLALAAPILIPLTVLELIVCGITGQSCEC